MEGKTTRERTLIYLYRELRNSKIALGNALQRPGVTREELDNLKHKVAMFDWLTVLVNQTEVN